MIFRLDLGSDDVVFFSEITLPYNGNVVGILLISFQIDISFGFQM
jgi:hypothetical protein